MKKETFDRAAELDSKIIHVRFRLNTIKNAKMINLSDDTKEKLGSSKLSFLKEGDGSCSEPSTEDKRLFAQLQKILQLHYQTELKRLESEFARIK